MNTMKKSPAAQTSKNVPKRKELEEERIMEMVTEEIPIVPVVIEAPALTLALVCLFPMLGPKNPTMLEIVL